MTRSSPNGLGSGWVDLKMARLHGDPDLRKWEDATEARFKTTCSIPPTKNGGSRLLDHKSGLSL